MQGQILDYSIQSGQGVITADDGNRYTFSGSQWRAAGAPLRGMRVDFDVQDGAAVSIYLALTGAPPGSGNAIAGGKSKIAAGLLGILLGGLGIHKFYLGYTKPGVIMLLFGTIGWCLIIPGLVVALIGLIEGIIYLTKSDAEFEQEYVLQRKGWF